jgi:hypothetical protein
VQRHHLTVVARRLELLLARKSLDHLVKRVLQKEGGGGARGIISSRVSQQATQNRDNSCSLMERPSSTRQVCSAGDKRQGRSSPGHLRHSSNQHPDTGRRQHFMQMCVKRPNKLEICIGIQPIHQVPACRAWPHQQKHTQQCRLTPMVVLAYRRFPVEKLRQTDASSMHMRAAFINTAEKGHHNPADKQVSTERDLPEQRCARSPPWWCSPCCWSPVQ